MCRDIVQFVPFADFKDRSFHELAMATLDEVPREVVNYFGSRGVTRTTPTEHARRTGVFVIFCSSKAVQGCFKFKLDATQHEDAVKNSRTNSV